MMEFLNVFSMNNKRFLFINRSIHIASFSYVHIGYILRCCISNIKIVAFFKNNYPIVSAGKPKYFFYNCLVGLFGRKSGQEFKSRGIDSFEANLLFILRIFHYK